MSIKQFAWIPVIVFFMSIAILLNYGLTSVQLAESNNRLSGAALQLTKSKGDLKACISNINELVQRVYQMEQLISAARVEKTYRFRTRCLSPLLEHMGQLSSIHRLDDDQNQSRQLLLALGEQTSYWLEEAEKIIGLTPAESILTQHAFNLASEEINETLTRFEAHLRNVPKLISQQNERQLSSLYRVLFLSALVFTALMACVFILMHRFTSNIDRIAAAMRELRKGNVAIDVSLQGNNRELKRLAEGVHSFRDALVTVLKGEERYEYLASYDSLTNLVNRRSLMELGHGLIEQQPDGPLVVFKIDLDKFKQVNDTYGHAAGDAFLVDTASVMQSALRDGDTLARLGGDEFAAVLKGPDPVAAWPVVIERLMLAISEPVRHSNVDIDRSISVGISLYPENGISFDQLLVNADVALYEAKSRGRQCYVLVNESMLAAHQAKIDLSRELESAVLRDEFVAYFQPKVSTPTSEIVGFEALVRWKHPERGILSPFWFIETAESSSLINQIGEKVLLEAITATRLLQDAGIQSNISINASVRELSTPGYAERFLATLADNTVNTDAISIELLETVALENTSEQISVNLALLHAQGVRIWIDDFGVGFSTVGVLQHHYIHGIKIDRRFVCAEYSEPKDRTLLGSITGMARGMGKYCVLEGVETEAQMNYATLIGCDAVQGYFHAKPMPVDAVLTWWREHDSNHGGDDRRAA